MQSLEETNLENAKHYYSHELSYILRHGKWPESLTERERRHLIQLGLVKAKRRGPHQGWWKLEV